MNRFLVSLYIICLMHAQVPRNSVNAMIVNDINSDSNSGGSFLARDMDSETASENHHQQLLQQHRLRHIYNQNHQNHQNHPNHPNHNSNHNQYPNQHHESHANHNGHHRQTESHHHVDGASHNDVEIGHIQPNMVKFCHKHNSMQC